MHVSTMNFQQFFFYLGVNVPEIRCVSSALVKSLDSKSPAFDHIKSYKKSSKFSQLYTSASELMYNIEILVLQDVKRSVADHLTRKMYVTKLYSS